MLQFHDSLLTLDTEGQVSLLVISDFHLNGILSRQSFLQIESMQEGEEEENTYIDILCLSSQAAVLVISKKGVHLIRLEIVSE